MSAPCARCGRPAWCRVGPPALVGPPEPAYCARHTGAALRAELAQRAELAPEDLADRAELLEALYRFEVQGMEVEGARLTPRGRRVGALLAEGTPEARRQAMALLGQPQEGELPPQAAPPAAAGWGARLRRWLARDHAPRVGP